MGPKFTVTVVDILFALHVYRRFTYPIDGRPEPPYLKAGHDRLSMRERHDPHFAAGDVVTGLRTG